MSGAGRDGYPRLIARLAVVHHLEQPFLGLAAEPFRAAGLELDERFLARGDALPEPGGFDGLVSFGGAQSFLERPPELLAEAELLRETAQAGVPVLGICLGAQILAAALGGEVSRDERRTVAWHALTPVVDDPLFDGPFPALHWNEDIFSLPPGAVELFGRHGNGVEAFRYGDSAWAVQFHPDVDRAALEGWYARYGSWLPPAGVDEATARGADDEHWAAHERAATGLFTGFAALVRAREPGTRASVLMR